MGIYVNFTKTTHQIWSCQVTLASNVKNFYFLPSSVLNFRQVTNFGGNWPKNKKVTNKKQIGGGKHPPSAYRVRETSTDVSHSHSLVTVQYQPINHFPTCAFSAKHNKLSFYNP